MKPICSVVMPLRRLDAYAEAAIDSIVGQTLRNIELVLVVHQGSVEVRAQIADFAGSATRCVVVDSQSEKLSEVRNAGIAAANGTYYAALDADDIAHSHRLQHQVRFLEEHAECVAVGSWSELIDDKGRIIGLHRTKQVVGFSFRYGLFFQPALIHSSLVCRMADVRRIGGYSTWFRAAHDQDLLMRLSRFGTLRNVSEPLVQYRIHDGPARLSNRHRRFQALASVRLAQLMKADATIPVIAHSDDPARRIRSMWKPQDVAYFRWLYAFLLIEGALRSSRPAKRDFLAFLRVTAKAVLRAHVSVRTAVVASLRLLKRLFLDP